jgi:hypothetical protein
MIPMLSWAGFGVFLKLFGMWPTEISFGWTGSEMSQTRDVGRKAPWWTVFTGSSISSRASA